MNLTPTPIRLALAAAFSLAAAGAAQAGLIQTTAPAVFSNSASVTDTQGGGSATLSSSLGTSALTRFNPSTGVLLGTTLILDSTRSQTITVSASAQSNAKDDATTSGSGFSTATLSAPGVSGAFAKIETSTGCSGTKVAGCSNTFSPGGSATPLTAPVDIAVLDAYVGAGTVLVSRSASLTATQVGNDFPGQESTTYKLEWAGDVAAKYEYLEHAAPSFLSGSDLLTLDLDFGTFIVGSTAELGFSIFNLAGDRVGLDLDSIAFVGDGGKFSTGLSPFASLGAGGFNPFLASMNTASAGTFSASYLLNLSDADIGAPSSRYSYTMALNLRGTVAEAPTNGVPEPSVMALVGLGLTSLAWAGRRRRR